MDAPNQHEIPQLVIDPTCELVRELFATFLEDFVGEDGETHEYLEQISVMKENRKTSIYVDFGHVSLYNMVLAEHIEAEYMKYEPFLKSAVQNVVRRHAEDFIRDHVGAPEKEFWVHFYNLPNILRLRDMNSSKISKLTSFCGTVTRTTEVHPELLLGSFSCLDCSSKIPDLEQRFKYTQPTKCSNAACENKTRWMLDMENSKFVDWQKVRVQENSNEIPSGSMPRHMEVILRQDAVEKAKAGDKCVFIGTLIVIPDLAAAKLPGGTVQLDRQTEQAQQEGEGVMGLKDQGVRPLTFKLAFLATTVRPMNSQHGVVNIRSDEEFIEGTEPDEAEVLAKFTDQEKEDIYRMRHEPHIYKRLARSIAPAIFGHEEVKKGILLMLFGGVHKKTSEGINLRGDINLCVVGDPSVAKSQFLKYVTSLVPRAVYTSGKASTAAGLTATVVKDPETSEYNIEAGALMLADSGICCIDEFDKMDPADQVAIHEAMEQQTISISKAGIHATLNARTSILAAANPIGGRYDKSRSLKANLTITPAIMSRFDLLFVVLDKNDEITDINIARHIVSVHQKRDKALNPEYSQAQIQRYIKFARTLKPVFTKDARRKLVQEYCNLRMSDQGKGKTAWRITVRQLESMVRLSEAIARVHLEPLITEAFVEEASRLLRQSIINIFSDDVELEEDLRPNPTELPIFSNRPPNTETEQNNDEDVQNQDQPPADNPPLEDSNAEATKETRTSGKRKAKITRDEYDRIRNLVVLHLHSRSQSHPDDKAISQRALIDWYLSEMGSTFTSQEDIKYHRAIFVAVIGKLITTDHILKVVDPGDGTPDTRLLSVSEEYQLDEFGL